MNEAHRQTRSHLMKLFAEHGFHPRGDLGQNFLIDLNIVQFVADQAEIGPNDVVLEVGTGTGGLTMFLAPNAAAVVTVEYDRNVFSLALPLLQEFPNITALNADALKNKNRINPEVLALVERKLAEGPERELKLVANLPYNVATPLIANLLASELPWSCMIVTIQMELALRMTARPKFASNYGALSVWLQSQCRVKLLKKLGPQVFWPRPNVESAIVSILPDPERRARIVDRTFFHDFVRDLFTQRRKHLRVVLHSQFRDKLERSAVDGILTDLGLAPNARAEELEVETLVTLGNRVFEHITAAKQTPST